MEDYKKQRLSNIELLRIVCMVFVVAGHANYLVHDLPTKAEFVASPYSMIGRSFAYQLGVVAVNCFVFISGWFSIKPSIKKGTSLIIQSLEYGLGLSLFFLILGFPFSKLQFLRLFFIGDYYWFIIAYLQLYILSPFLNSFSEKASPNELRLVVMSFFIFEFFYGWIGNVGKYAAGYSGIHFVGLYILAQYIRRHVKYARITLTKSVSFYLFPAAMSVAAIGVGGGHF